MHTRGIRLEEDDGSWSLVFHEGNKVVTLGTVSDLDEWLKIEVTFAQTLTTVEVESQNPPGIMYAFEPRKLRRVMG